MSTSTAAGVNPAAARTVREEVDERRANRLQIVLLAALADDVGLFRLREAAGIEDPKAECARPNVA